MPAALLSRRTLFCVLAVGALALLAAGRASAGYGVGPDGQTFTVTANSAGFVQAPASLDLVVYLDAEDSSSAVWVSDSPAIGAAGVPVGRNLGSCSSGSLLPFGEANKWVCRVSTSQLQPGHTYYWWLSFARQDPGTPAPTDRVSGPFSFSLVQAATPPPPPPVPAPPPVVKDPHAPVSTKTIAAAATLPSSTVFNGRRSVKHTTLTRLVYRTMKQLGYPRQLAFACWNRSDWLSVLAAEGAKPESGNSQLLGFWLGRQPRWLHLAPGICTDLQGLLSSKQPNARRAGALSTVIHETLHAYGVVNEAQTNCMAVQLVPVFGWNLGLSDEASGLSGDAGAQLRAQVGARGLLERCPLPRRRSLGSLPDHAQPRLRPGSRSTFPVGCFGPAPANEVAGGAAGDQQQREAGEHEERDRHRARACTVEGRCRHGWALGLGVVDDRRRRSLRRLRRLRHEARRPNPERRREEDRWWRVEATRSGHAAGAPA